MPKKTKSPEKPAKLKAPKKKEKKSEEIDFFSTDNPDGNQSAVSPASTKVDPNGKRRESAMWPTQQQQSPTKPKQMPSNSHVHRTQLDVGLVARGECEYAVLAADSGDFLVRHGTDWKSYVLCINDSNIAVQNYKLAVNETSGDIEFMGEQYKTLGDAINRLRRSDVMLKSGRKVKLGQSASHCDWFVGCMADEDVQKLLAAAGDQDYVVRLAVTPERTEYEICINDRGAYKKSVIMRSKSGAFVTESGIQFQTCSELIEYARDNSIAQGSSGRNLYLRKVAAAAEWYVGIMPRDAVEQAVEEGESGCFLIRQGKTDPNSFVLVVQSATGKATSIKITKGPNGFTLLGEVHTTMEAMIRHVKKKPLSIEGQSCTLSVAAPRPVDHLASGTGAGLKKSNSTGTLSRKKAFDMMKNRFPVPFRVIALKANPDPEDMHLKLNAGDTIFVLAQPSENLYTGVSGGMSGLVYKSYVAPEELVQGENKDVGDEPDARGDGAEETHGDDESVRDAECSGFGEDGETRASGDDNGGATAENAADRDAESAAEHTVPAADDQDDDAVTGFPDE